MVKIDQLKEMSVEALQNLITNAQNLVNQYEKDKKKAVIREIKTLAASANLNIDIKEDEVIKPKGKSVTKYRNPDNPNETWTGRGKRPRWLNDALASGKNLDDFSA
jgi:DNA-binding protein H-NS